MASTWSEEETITLIDLWGDEKIQEELQNCTRNRSVYERLSRQLEAVGYTRTMVQCREKMKKLRAEYKKVKDNNGLITGRGTRRWRYYDKLDAILGHRPATAPPIVLDTSAVEVRIEQTSVSNDNTDDDTSEQSETEEATDDLLTVIVESTGEQLEDVDQAEENGGSQAVTIGEKAQAQVDKNDDKTQADKNSDTLGDKNDKTLTDKTPVDKSDKTPTEKDGKTKRTRPSKKEVVEKTIEHAMKRAAKTQEDSDTKMLAIEEKCLKFNELVLEMENKRWKEDREREERQRREEREFQLKVKLYTKYNI